MGNEGPSRRAVLGALGEENSESGQDDKAPLSRRGLLRGVVAGGVAAGGLGLSVGSAAAASRQQVREISAGDYSDPAGIDMAIYRAQTNRTGAIDLFYEKAQHIFGQLTSEDIITGWRITMYDTSRDSVDNNKGENWGSYDVKRIYDDEGWTDEDLGLWFTGEAKIWDKSAGTYNWESVSGGSAGYQTAFDPDSRSKIAPCWMSTSNPDDRVVAHGASMEIMHAIVDGGLGPVSDCHGGHGEHSLGDAVYEYNEDYGESGFYGSPLASGPHTWQKGSCAAGVSEKNGVTFTLTPCTKQATEYTKRDRVPGLSLGSGDGCGLPPYRQTDHTLTIEGTEYGFNNYTFVVGDTLEKSTANGASINGHDNLTTTSGDKKKVEGKTWKGKDSYVYTGRIGEFTAEDPGALVVTLDGNEVYPDSLDADVIVIDGSGNSGWSSYDISATGQMEKTTVDGASINGHDSVNGSSASGWTYNGKDAYRFLGGVEKSSDLSDVGFSFL